MNKQTSVWGLTIAMMSLFSMVRYSAEKDATNPNYLIIRDNSGKKVRVQIPDDVTNSDRYSIKLNKEILERLFPESSKEKENPTNKVGQVSELEKPGSSSEKPGPSSSVEDLPPKVGNSSDVSPTVKSGDMQNSVAPVGGGGGGGGSASGTAKGGENSGTGHGGMGAGGTGSGTGSGSGSGSGTAMGGSGGSCAVGPIQPNIEVSLNASSHEDEKLPSPPNKTEPEESDHDRRTKIWLEDEIRKLSREMQRMSDMQTMQHQMRSMAAPQSGAHSQAGTSPAESLMFMRLGEIQEKLKNMELQKELDQQSKILNLKNEIDSSRKDRSRERQEAFSKKKNQQYIQALQEIRSALKDLKTKKDKASIPPEVEHPKKDPSEKNESSKDLEKPPNVLTPYAYKKWNEDMPDVSRKVLRANTLYHQGKYLEAMDELNRAESINPYDARVKMMKGSLFYKLGWIDYATKFWEKSLLIDPTQRYLYTYIENAKREKSAMEIPLDGPSSVKN